MATLIAGAAGIDFDKLLVSDLLLGDVTTATATQFVLRDGPWLEEFSGQFTYANDSISGGTLTGWKESLSGQTVFEVTGFSLPVTQFVTWATTNNNEAAKTAILAGNDSLLGSEMADRMHAYAGGDTLSGGGGQDYLRGDDGEDSLSGGAEFDDLHGNMGNDTVVGGLGDDWVRGGRGNDSLGGGDGDDWMSGDLGDDTLSGGAGADTFNVFGGAGVERVLDFNLAEGDRVHVETGSTYTTTQVGADVVISVNGDAQMTLVGVNLTSLHGDWIFTG